MGRNAAGDSFLKGFLTYYSTEKDLFIQVSNQSHIDQFSSLARRFGHLGNIKSFSNINLGVATQAGNLYYPGPDIGQHAHFRNGIENMLNN